MQVDLEPGRTRLWYQTPQISLTCTRPLPGTSNQTGRIFSSSKTTATFTFSAL